MASLLAPLYIAEVSPARIRGRFVHNQMAIVSGILLPIWSIGRLVIFGPRLALDVRLRRVPAAFFLALFFVPESPRWLAEIPHPRNPLAILTRVNGPAVAARE